MRAGKPSFIKSLRRALPLLAILLIAGAADARAACLNPAGNAAEIVYNETEKTFQYCDDTKWVAMNKPGGGAGGCNNPTLDEGKMVYNADHRVVQGCAGTIHRAFGPVGGLEGNNWVKISAGDDFACGIKADGTAWCWGSDVNGELGNGPALTSRQATPTPVAGGGTWIEISSSTSHSCGIKSDGTAWCWGGDGSGRLGNGPGLTADQDSPSAVDSVDTWIAISAGIDFSCGIKSDGTAWCWGNDTNGRLGNGATAGSQASPSPVDSVDTWVAISAGPISHACGIKTDGTAWCWGDDANDKLGNGATAGNQISPSAVNSADDWIAISAGQQHTCGIKTDGTAWCWGIDTNGQSGNGVIAGSQISPSAVDSADDWIAISTGQSHSCGIKVDNSIWCWGSDSSGQLGNGSGVTGNQISPFAVSSTDNWVAVSTGRIFSCGIRENGTAACWGSGDQGQLGQDEVLRDYMEAPETLIVGGSAWLTVSGGTTYSCGLKTEGSAWCWGSDIGGALGNGVAITSDQLSPSAVDTTDKWLMISTSTNRHTCGIKMDRSAWCWGQDTNGKLGNGAALTVDQVSPSPVEGTDSWIDIGAGNNHSCGIKTDGSAWCWGSDVNGRLGNGAGITGDQPSPTPVDSPDTWIAIRVGTSHTCGIKTDKSAWCWGGDTSGQLGNGAVLTGDQVSPTPVEGTDDWIDISASNSYTCGIKADRSGWCWGSDATGQLGNGVVLSASQVSPSPIDSPDSWVLISAGNAHACGIKADRTAWCWGQDTHGKLGNGSILTADQVSPSAVVLGGITNWYNISAAPTNTCAVTGGKKAFCWGLGSAGQLGIGSILLTYSSDVITTFCAEPSAPAGRIIYNSTGRLMQYCDGAGWVAMGQPEQP